MKVMRIKYTKWGIAALLLFSLSKASFGQQYIDPALSGSYKTLLNPSFNALLTQGEGDAALLYRYQWVGLEGAPKSLWFNGNIGLGHKNVALGINAKQFSIGVEKSTEVSANFTKILPISDVEFIGLGINLGYTRQSGNYSSLDPADPAFGNVAYGTLLYGLSASLVRPDRYYVGVSLPRVIFGKNDSDYVRQFGRDNSYYVSGGAVFDLDASIYIRPSFLVSYRAVTNLSFDASAMVFFTSKFGVGAGYRQRGDMMGMAEFNFAKLRLAYSYQQNLKNSNLNRYINNSTHELGLSIQFGKGASSRL